jgi:hypothetical protein
MAVLGARGVYREACNGGRLFSGAIALLDKLAGHWVMTGT